jgi:acyl-CoA synthetase (AMP-forming)/AMP-acid ligase II
VVAIEGPLPPGCMQTVWRDDARFVNTYWKRASRPQVYSTFDWGIRDADGYYFILGRTDDVINVAGHRLGTREIEESISATPTWPRWPWWAWPTAQGPGGHGLCRARRRCQRAWRRRARASSSKARS